YGQGDSAGIGHLTSLCPRRWPARRSRIARWPRGRRPGPLRGIAPERARAGLLGSAAGLPDAPAGTGRDAGRQQQPRTGRLVRPLDKPLTRGTVGHDADLAPGRQAGPAEPDDVLGRCSRCGTPGLLAGVRINTGRLDEPGTVVPAADADLIAGLLLGR